MRVFFLAASNAGFGETLIGLSLAQQLKSAQISSFFVVDAMCRDVLSESGFPFAIMHAELGPALAERTIRRSVARFNPDVIVLSDYFIHYCVFPTSYNLDPCFINDFGVPVLPIDIWEWSRTSFEIDVFLGKTMKVSEQIRRMPIHLRPVPICHPPVPSDNASCHFPLFPKLRPIDEVRRRQIRQDLGLAPDDRLIMTSLARWQRPPFGDFHGDRIAEAVPKLLGYYLDRLPPRVHVLTVGAAPLDLLTARGVHHFPPTTSARFAELLASSDLFLTLNVGATTLARSIASHVPSLALVNSLELSPGESVRRYLHDKGLEGDAYFSRWLQDAAPLYRFRMWPVGFFAFVDSLLADNPYCRTFETAELLDPDAVMVALERLLFDKRAQAELNERRHAYLETVEKLPPTCDAFIEATRKSQVV